MKKNPLNDIIARTCTDKPFREQFLRDPAGVLRGAGIQVPEGTKIKIIENTDEKIHVVLPTAAEEQPGAWACDARPEPGSEVRTNDLVMMWSEMGLELEGRITSDSTQALRQQLDRAEGNLLVDFSQVTFMGSAGLGVFLATQKRLAAKGKQLCLCDVSPPIRSVFSLTGLDSYFKFVTADLKSTWWMAFPIV